MTSTMKELTKLIVISLIGLSITISVIFVGSLLFSSFYLLIEHLIGEMSILLIIALVVLLLVTRLKNPKRRV